ncbi:MAG: hypothetical protein ACTSVE_05025, partial [Candidatus Helarchaeota archaeon]
LLEDESIENFFLYSRKSNVFKSKKEPVFVPIMIDSSSIFLELKQIHETYLTNKETSKFDDELTFDYDFFIKMPPKKEWKKKVKIKKIIKATPKIIDIEEK